VSPRAHLLEARGIVGDGLDGEPELTLEVGELGLGRSEPIVQHGERLSVGEGGDGHADPVERARLDRTERIGQGLAMRGGVAEERLFGLERHLLPRVLDLGLLDLGDLEADEVDLAGAGTRVAAERRELVVQSPRVGSGDAEVAEWSAASPA
jgi:hypothetical protein